MTPPSSSHHAHASGWSAFIHHLQLALLVASIVGLLHHAGTLGWLDALMLRLSGSVHAQSVQPPGPNAVPPAVFLIGEDLYEAEFGQRAPLDRHRLAKLFRALPTDPAQRPATVVVDLDLSPVAGDVAAQEELDRALQHLVASDIRLVLPLPIPVRTTALRQLKIDWMQRLCQWRSEAQPSAGGVRLANTEMITHAAQALQFDPAALTLGVAATWPKHFDDVCQFSAAQQRAILSSNLPAHVLRIHHSLRQAREPYNARYFGGADDHTHLITSLDQLPRTETQQPVSVAGRVLFIGGAYEGRDRFHTPLEPSGQSVEGVALHAATFYSMLHPIHVEQGFIALGLDIIAGIGLGYLFAWSWGCHSRSQMHCYQHGGWRGYAGPKVMLVMNFSLAAALVVLLVWGAATWAYPHNWWVSPGPMVLGMFTKFLLTSRHNNHAQTNAALPAAARWIDRLVFTGLVLTNLGVIVMHSFGHP